MPNKVFLKFILCSVLLLFMQYSFAQKIITGKVTDENSNPIQNASVLIKENKVGTSTDVNGIFKIKHLHHQKQLSLVISGAQHRKYLLILTSYKTRVISFHVIQFFGL